MSSEEKLQQHIDVIRRYYDQLSEKYDEVTQKTSTTWTAPEEANDFILPHVKPNDEVLDLGIGTGQSSEAAYDKGANITGIDISEEMIEKARNKFPQWNLYQHDLTSGLPSDIKKRSYDAVISVGVLEFIPNKEPLIEEVADVMGENSYFVFTYEDIRSNSDFQSDPIGEAGNIENQQTGETETFLHYRQTHDEIKNLLKKNNLKIIKQKEFIAYKKSTDQTPVHFRCVLTRKDEVEAKA